MYMRAILTFVATLSAMTLTAGVPSITDSINASESIHVTAPAALTARLHADAGRAVPQEETAVTDEVRPVTARSGYRVQVYDDNNARTARQGAQSTAARVSAAFPQLRSYVSFQSPYWRAKVGDFRSRAEAENMLEEIRAAFPGLRAHLRIVRDRINIE